MTDHSPGEPERARTGGHALRLGRPVVEHAVVDEVRALLAAARRHLSEGAWDDAARYAAETEAVVKRTRPGPADRASTKLRAELTALAGAAGVVTGLLWSEQGSTEASRRAFAQAAATLREAAEVQPPERERSNDLGVALAGAGKAGEQTEAVELLQAAVADGTADVVVRRSLGLALLATGRSKEAVTVLGAVVEDAPDNWLAAQAYATAVERAEGRAHAGEAWGSAAETMWRAGQLDDALAALARADAQMPGDWRVPHLRARMQAETGALDEALANACLADSIMSSGQTKRLVARLLDRLGRTEDALAELRSAITQDPSDRATLLYKATLLVDLNRFDEALDVVGGMALGDEDPQVALLRGSALLGRGDSAAAVGPLTDSARLDPDNPVAHARLGLALALVGDRPTGLRHLDRALDLDPQYVWALVRRAEVRADLGSSDSLDPADAAAARADLERAVELLPRLPELYDQLGRVCLASDLFDDAAAAYEQLTEVAPDDAYSWFAYGDALERAGRYRAAADSYAKASAIAPDTAELLVARARAHVELDDPEGLREAERLARAAIDLDSDSAEAYLQLGVALARQDDLDGAVRAFDEVLAQRPDDLAALYNRGQVLAMQRKGREAVEALSQAADLAPEDPQVQGAFAQAYLMVGGERPARTDATKLRAAATLLAAKETPEQLLLAGRVHAFLGDNRSAQRAFRSVLRLDPSSTTAHVELADVLAAEGHPVEAIAHYEEAARGNPDDVYPLYQAGGLMLDVGRHADAVRLLESARDSHPNVAEVRGTLAEAYRLLGRYEDALREADAALEVAELPSVLAVRGAVKLATGDPRGAETDLRRSLEQDPQSLFTRFQMEAAMSAMGRHPEATALFGELVQRHPDETDLRADYAAALLVDGDLRRALATIEQVAWDRPDDPYVLRIAGAILLSSGRHDEALVSYQRAADREPSVETLTELADAQARTGQVVAALRTVDAAIAHGPARWPLVRKAWYLSDLAAYAQAVAVARRAATKTPIDSSAPAVLCWALEHGGGDPHEVLAVAEEAVRLDPTAAWIHKIHANALWGLGDPSAAHVYERAIALIDEQDNRDERYNRGWCLYRLRRYREAVAEYQRALVDLHDEQVSLMFDIGLTSLEMAEHGQAEDAYRRGLKLAGAGEDLRARGWLAVGAHDLRQSLNRGLVVRSALASDLLGRLDSQLAGIALPDLAPFLELTEAD